jgi:DNA-binding transcriptional ArsR family regulator
MESENSPQAILKLLEKISLDLENLGEKLDKVIELQEALLKHSRLGDEAARTGEPPLDAATLLSLPDHLRKSAMAVCKLGEATASQVSSETGRVRAAESDYLNQLVTMGYIKKKRKGRDVYFYIEK